MKAMQEEIKAVEGLRKAAEQLPEANRPIKRRSTNYKHRKRRRTEKFLYDGQNLCYLLNKSLCVPVRARVNTSTSSSMR